MFFMARNVPFCIALHLPSPFLLASTNTMNPFGVGGQVILDPETGVADGAWEGPLGHRDVVSSEVPFQVLPHSKTG